MWILTIRTDKPEAEIGLYQDGVKRQYITWQAHRQLAETLHSQLRALLAAEGKLLADIEGIICYQGPGSFTGLRIGLTVANALSYMLQIPIVAAMDDQPDGWIVHGLHRLSDGQNDLVAMPEYGADANITLPKAIANS